MLFLMKIDLADLGRELTRLKDELNTAELSKYLLDNYSAESLKNIDLITYKDLWVELIKNPSAYSVFAEKMYSESNQAKQLIKTYGMKKITEALEYISTQRKRV